MKMKNANSVRRCRLCAREEDLNDFHNIFDENPALEIEMKITKLLPIVVMPWDPMPHKVCNSCIEKLNLFDEFYEGSLRAEKFLRTLYPCAPEKQVETSESVVQVLEPPILGNSAFALTPKNLSNASEPKPEFEKRSPEQRAEPGKDPPEAIPRRDSRRHPKRSLSCFIIHELTSRDSIFTCRECFRTFTKESSALTHTCVRLEDCQELGAMGGEKEGGKSLPPLKIRLFSMKSGLFICYLCQAPFEDKTKLVPHIKSHFVDGNWNEEEEEEEEQEVVKQKGKRKSVEDEDWLTSVRKGAAKRKKKKCLGPGRKGGRRKTADSLENCQEEACETCNDSLKVTTEEPMEQTDMLIIPEEEIEIKYEKIHKMASEDPPKKETDGEGDGEAEKNEPAVVTEEDILNVGCEEEKMNEDVILEEDSAEDRSEEVTVVQMVKNKTPTSFSSCVFCDKIFATKGGLIVHQRKHLQGCLGVKFEEDELKWTPEGNPIRPPDSDTFFCSICAMMFTNKKTLLEHQQYHLVDMDAIG